ncbi:hypothetical protein OIV83_000026 [Microbotryomycetes sp. JL201]|nr:hypothetical protein OIV83_000026 [Microbotryomycetes sp. JL201]
MSSFSTSTRQGAPKNLFSSPPRSPTLSSGDSDVFFTPPSSVRALSSGAPSTKSGSSSHYSGRTSPTLCRSTSPQRHTSSKLMRKLNNKWHSSSSRRDELDFGCAGEEVSSAQHGGAAVHDDVDRWYNTYGGQHRSSVASSSLPSLTHSRGHSSSSEFSSVSTADSSLPPSPIQQDCVTFSPVPLSPLPYTSRVPLTPKSAQRKRQSDEVAAVEALNHYFTNARLSRVEEDVATPESTSPSWRRSLSNGRAERVDALLSANHVNTPPSRRAPMDLQICFDGSDNESSYTPVASLTPLTPDTSPYSPSIKSESHLSAESSDSGGSTIYRGSPVPDADMSEALEELSVYFTSTSRIDAVPQTRCQTPPLSAALQSQTTLRSPISLVSRRSVKRPTNTSSAGVKIGLTPPLAERRVSYSWI